MAKKYEGEILIEDAKDKKQWDDFVTSHEEANFLQSWDFYEFEKARGNEIVRRVAFRGDKVAGVYAGEVEHAKRGRHMAIAGGPIFDWEDKALRDAIFKDIKKEGRRQNCVFVRVRPQLEDGATSRAIFKMHGFRPAPMYLSVEYAGVIDISKTEEEVMAGMRQRLRRAIRKGLKNHITIEKSTDPKDVKTFYNIQLETAKRHNFYAFSEDFLTKQFSAFAPNGEAVLYIAKYEGEILAENMMIFYGNEASYHYGVSSELGTKLSGAPLLHLEAMRDARKRGIKRYNLWGIVDVDDTKHRFYGVSEFKRGFGPDELHYLHAQDLVLKKFQYFAKTWVIETIRRKVRHV